MRPKGTVILNYFYYVGFILLMTFFGASVLVRLDRIIELLKQQP